MFKPKRDGEREREERKKQRSAQWILNDNVTENVFAHRTFFVHLTPVCVTSTMANNYGLTSIRCMCRPKQIQVNIRPFKYNQKYRQL